MAVNVITKFHVHITVIHEPGLTDITDIINGWKEGSEIEVLTVKQVGRDVLLLNTGVVNEVLDLRSKESQSVGESVPGL